MQDEIFLLGYKKNVYKYIALSDCLICSSLWEDPGFVMIENTSEHGFVSSLLCQHKLFSLPHLYIDTHRDSLEHY